MNFLERAKILTDRGVPVAPVIPGDKRCILPGWPDKATTDWDQIKQWAETAPEANTAAVCRSDGFVILDSDSVDLATIVAPLIPTPTFIVLSGGKRLPHYYFSQTDASRALGNAIVMQGETRLADLQSNRKYVVGPMSKLATGNEYKIASDAPIQPVPSELVAWLREHSIIEQPKYTTPLVTGNGSELDAEFDFEAFCKHFNITGHWKGNWFLTDWCPVSGFPHNGSKHTGIYFDGNRLGFHCFAAGCEGAQMSFGQVLRHLNSIQEPYRGPIWKDDSEKWLKNWRRNAAV